MPKSLTSCTNEKNGRVIWQTTMFTRGILAGLNLQWRGSRSQEDREVARSTIDCILCDCRMISTLEEKDTSRAHLFDTKNLWASHIMNGLSSIAHVNKLTRNKLSEAREITS
jgi:hypothetical protein